MVSADVKGRDTGIAWFVNKSLDRIWTKSLYVNAMAKQDVNWTVSSPQLQMILYQWQQGITGIIDMILSYLTSPWTKRGHHSDRQHFEMHFLEWKQYNSDFNFPEICPKSPIENKLALVQVMAWRRTDNKPLPEPILTQFTDAYMRL